MLHLTQEAALGPDLCFQLQPRKQYTAAQVKDILHVRGLYYGKLGQLYRERKELRSQVPFACVDASEAQSAPDNYTTLSQLAKQLRINAAEEYSVFLQCFCTFWRGVCPCPLPYTGCCTALKQNGFQP